MAERHTTKAARVYPLEQDAFNPEPITEFDLFRKMQQEEMKETKEKLRSYETALNRASKSIRDIELKLGIKQIGISSIGRSKQYIAQKPVKPLVGKVSVPDIMGMEKLPPKKANEMIATEISF